MPISLPEYFNRFDEGDRYEDLLFRASKGLQSAELNEVQAVQANRLKKIADAVFRDGAVIQGAPPSINTDTGETVCPDSVVYIKGAMRAVPTRTFTIPTTGLVQIGVFLLSSVITEDEDATLRDPATGTRNYNEPGAARLQEVPTWGHDGEGLQGVFFPVYTVINGALYTQPVFDNAFIDALARYDREANGSYIVRGLDVRAIGAGTYSVGSGVGNVFGYKLDRVTSTRFIHAEDPDLEDVTSEPDAFVNSSTDIQLNRTPVESIQEVVATVERTTTLTRGGAAGGQDTLPDVSVVTIQSVTQGGTTYTDPADFFLNGDKVDWSPGGAEPAPGSTYSITYRYLSNVTPTNVDLAAGTFRVSGAVPGQLILTDYRWKLPRYDRICLNRENLLVRVTGIPSRYTPVPPRVSSDLLWLATVYQEWRGTPTVSNDGIRAVPFDQIEKTRALVLDLFDLVAQERLRWDMSAREPTTKRGVFVDPFLDDDLRDLGQPQTAAVVRGELVQPIIPSLLPASLNRDQEWMLPYVETTALSQLLRTGGIKINPYGGFTPLQGTLTLNPAIDRWTERVDNVTSGPTERVRADTEFAEDRGLTEGDSLSRRTVVDVDVTSGTIRELDVDFTVKGFNESEPIASLTFDGVDVTPPGLTADSSGEASGTFTIPAGVPSGVRAVVAVGGFGSVARTVFVGQTLVVTREIRRTRVQIVDPVAQTFRLDLGRWITSAEFWVTTKGSAANPVTLQIREVELGVPTGISIAEGRISGTALTAGAWNKITLDRPVFIPAGEEFAMVLLTDDLNHAVGIAEIGKTDVTTGAAVTLQPYLIGTLLKSSNSSTWTPFQEADLTFRLNAASFTANTRTVDLGKVQTMLAASITRSGTTATVAAVGHPFETGQTVIVGGADQTPYNGAKVITVTGPDAFTFEVTGSPVTPATGTIYLAPGRTSDLLVLAAAELPTAACGLEFQLTTAAGASIRLQANSPLALTEQITSGLSLSAILSGTTTDSPLLYPDTLTVLGDLQDEGTYITRAVPCAATAEIVVTYEALIPSAATVTIEAQNDVAAWLTVPQTTSTPLGDGVLEITHRLTFTDGGLETRCRVTLTGTPAARPYLKNFRMVTI